MNGKFRASVHGVRFSSQIVLKQFRPQGLALFRTAVRQP
jgi:hypothetical protein